MKRSLSPDAAPRSRVVSALSGDPIAEAIEWCVRHELVDSFVAAAETCDIDQRGLDFKFVAPEKLPFFIAVLPHCPHIKSINLPIPVAYGHATALTDALVRNSGLHRLQLHVSERAPPDSTMLHWVFSHHTPRAAALSELWIHIHAKPAGDTDWMRPLCAALSMHLKAESVQLTLPWTDGNLMLLGDEIRTNPFVLSLTVGGTLTRLGTQQLVDGLTHEGCRLKSLSFPDSRFDRQLVDDVIGAIEINRSLVDLGLGDTALTPGQRDAIDAVLARNQNLANWQYLTGSGPL